MSLIGEERKQKILDLLELNGNVSSTELVQLFDVSKETVRRYLDELEGQAKLKKVYGGAVKPSVIFEESPYLERITLKREEKNQIGRQAAGLIRDGEVIFLDEGTTLLTVIPHLTQTGLTVLTHSFPAATLLMEQQNQGRFDGRILFLGGEISALHARCAGSMTETALGHYYIDKAFISVDGIHAEAGLTSLDDSKSAVSRKAISHATEVIVAADYTKLGHRFPYKLGDLEDVTFILCNQAPPTDWDEALAKHPLRWITP
ncbi:DeoR/GlpR family DNA-binding transcription regulator [Paenibacillus sp. BC26]|uniref:DeoR/GlpR family DNA-binding transcription regulator n=1 Tax=Paenibacillus sp. BC26 TaxID=1881032 RepID=UPI0008F250B5|nr:DeoR/GlpR family DNA-binding transcription regulator [Paenibacillus sp. BC26]SFT24128.1 transcriptional regulator, DeoR family [Paenibacillus sp. BC26]